MYAVRWHYTIKIWHLSYSCQDTQLDFHRSLQMLNMRDLNVDCDSASCSSVSSTEDTSVISQRSPAETVSRAPLPSMQNVQVGVNYSLCNNLKCINYENVTVVGSHMTLLRKKNMRLFITLRVNWYNLLWTSKLMHQSEDYPQRVISGQVKSNSVVKVVIIVSGEGGPFLGFRNRCSGGPIPILSFCFNCHVADVHGRRGADGTSDRRHSLPIIRRCKAQKITVSFPVVLLGKRQPWKNISQKETKG